MAGVSKRSHNLKSKDIWQICNLLMILFSSLASKRKNPFVIKSNTLQMLRKENKPILILKTVTAVAVMSIVNNV